MNICQCCVMLCVPMGGTSKNTSGATVTLQPLDAPLLRKRVDWGGGVENNANVDSHNRTAPRPLCSPAAAHVDVPLAPGLGGSQGFVGP